MNRLQKKCVIATVGIHLLLLTILIVGPAFYNPKPKVDNTQVLDVISANLIDAALNSGVRGATPPPPAPQVTPPPPVQPPPPPQVQTPPPTPPKPVEPPTPSFLDRVEKVFKPAPKPELAKPATEKTEPQTHKIQVNTQLVTRTASKNSTANSKPDNSRAIASAIRNLKTHLSPGTTIDMPGDSTVAYANYASVVKSVYDRAWVLPDTIANDENITVRVTIASDGTVISSRIVTPSGDAPADASVQRTLDRVTFVAPFPEGSSDKQRTYTINFNPQIKKSE